MSTPAYVLTWKQLLTTGVPGLRIPYVSLADLTQNTIYNLKNFLITASGATTKPTLLWSAAGGTGPSSSSDHTDRLTNAAAVTPRGAATNASQAWFVMTYANGGQVLVSWTGASDDVFRVAFSPGGLYVLAGTANNCPTATDEQVLNTTSTSMVGATTSGDRILHILAQDNGNGFRCVVYRSASIVSPLFGVGELQSSATSPASIVANLWGFCISRSNTTTLYALNSYAQGTNGGVARAIASSVGYSLQLQTGSEHGAELYTYQPELQGAGFTPYPVAVHSQNATGARGRVGNLQDWYYCAPSGYVDGDGLGNSYQWVQQGAALWPNPSGQAPTIT